AALSLLLVVLALGLVTAEGGMRGGAHYHRSGAGAARSGRTVRLGRWRWPALAFVSLVTSTALAVPVAVLGYWLARGVMAGEPLRLVWSAALNSVYVSALAAAAAALAALPVAFLAVRYPGRLAALCERSTYVGFALPGIVVALSLVFFGANYATPLYQTLGLLVFAYVVLFLPAALGSIRAGLLQISPSLEEAARGLGRSPLRVFFTITVPLLRSGIVAGMALVFLVTMKELPATLLLSPIGFKTLATSIWAAASEAFFARAAAPALLLILVSSLSMFFLVSVQQRERA
ncbi:MAG: ABC transporter permease, partial [Dehalococcoidia bacterium]